MATEKTPRRLGRGLEALLGNAGGLASSDEGALKSIPIGQIGRNPFVLPPFQSRLASDLLWDFARINIVRRNRRRLPAAPC